MGPQVWTAILAQFEALAAQDADLQLPPEALTQVATSNLYHFLALLHT